MQDLGAMCWWSGGGAWGKELSTHQASPRNLNDFSSKASSEILGRFWLFLASSVGEVAVDIRREGVDPLHYR